VLLCSGLSVLTQGLKGKIMGKTEDKERHEIEMYGANAQDWLSRWDSGKSVWSIEMGGLGPGYEQCIHVTCAELLRFMLGKNYDHAFWEDPEIWARDREEITQASFQSQTIKDLGGITGAQFGAAMNLATMIYIHGPRSVMNDRRVKDRHIQVSKRFPGSQS
jgi:hypothetical protein